MYSWLLFLLALCHSNFVESSRILAVLPIASRSHHQMFQPIIKGLAKRGHQLTLITSYDYESNSTNIKQIIILTGGNTFIDTLKYEDILQLGSRPILYPPQMSFWNYGLKTSEECLSNENVQKLIKSKNEKFDLIILESSFGQECMIGFSKHFDAPAVSLNANINYIYFDEFNGNPLSLAITPHLESDLTNPMSFFDRLKNAIRSFCVLVYGYNFYLPKHEEIMNKYFNFQGQHSIVDMLTNNISLSISNCHVSLEHSRPKVPNSIDGAGLHIAKPPTALPEDLQKFMDDSTDGVIYFSLGTIIPAHYLPEKIKNDFLKAFSKIKQNVLWKINVDKVDNLPKNVKISRWLPQQSILAHPNCKAFITHGGMLSLQEATYYGVPLIGMPHFGDQFVNIGRAASIGIAIMIDNQKITEDVLLNAFKEIVENDSYSKQMKRYSRIFRDNPVEPLDKILYWIEYVIRHDGAKHLRSSKLDLPYYKYLLLDVVLFIFASIIVSVVILYYSFKYLLKKVLAKKQKIQNSNKKQK